MASAALAQTAAPLTPSKAPEPIPQPEPVETPIGTEAATLGNEAELREPLIQLPASITLSFASWDMGARKPGEATEQAPEPNPEPAKVWRHTFGAERTSAPWRLLPKPGVTSDVIAIRGVQKLIDIRRHFGAAAYHVVASQQLLARSAATSTGRAIFRLDAPATTALAFRRRRGVRLAGFRHFLPRPSPNAARASRAPEPPAITAFRLRIFHKLLWVASIDVPPECAISPGDPSALATPAIEQGASLQGSSAPSSVCAVHAPVLRRFIQWSATLAVANAPLALVGRWPTALPDELQRIGLTVSAAVASNVVCSPAPTGMLFAIPQASAIKAAEWAPKGTSKTNPCVGVAELTLDLRRPQP